MMRDPGLCLAVTSHLLEHHNMYIQPINYPTVAKGTERLRITPGPLHTETMIHDLVDALKISFEAATKDHKSQIA